jgi:hypothetical protein
METVSCNVDTLQPALRQAMEAVIGHALHANQRLIIQVLEVDASDETSGNGAGGSKLPAWCNVLSDLTPGEAAALEASLTARTESRSTATS